MNTRKHPKPDPVQAELCKLDKKLDNILCRQDRLSLHLCELTHALAEWCHCHGDTSKISEITAKLKTSTDALKASVDANQPPV